MPRSSNRPPPLDDQVETAIALLRADRQRAAEAGDTDKAERIDEMIEVVGRVPGAMAEVERENRRIARIQWAVGAGVVVLILLLAVAAQRLLG